MAEQSARYSSAYYQPALLRIHLLHFVRLREGTDPGQIVQLSDEALEGWICYMRDALEGEDKALTRRINQQFVAKIVIKEGIGMYSKSSGILTSIWADCSALASSVSALVK